MVLLGTKGLYGVWMGGELVQITFCCGKTSLENIKFGHCADIFLHSKKGVFKAKFLNNMDPMSGLSFSQYRTIVHSTQLYGWEM